MKLSDNALQWIKSASEYCLEAKEVYDYIKPHIETEEFNAAIHKNLQEQIDKLNEVG